MGYFECVRTGKDKKRAEREGKKICLNDLLSSYFSQAIEWSKLSKNPISGAKPPKVLTKEVPPWTKEQTDTFLKFV
ncbi:hypothetical protein [Metabacillus indicus]|uniref:hypothetical protein n=1 Tax=Metabacillus indicus TaxID=246786 RepID=UPI003CF437BC